MYITLKTTNNAQIGVKYSLRFEFPLSLCKTAKLNGKSCIQDKCQQHTLIESLVLWYEFESDGCFKDCKSLLLHVPHSSTKSIQIKSTGTCT